MSIVASAVNERRQFITLRVSLCAQRSGQNALHRAGPSAAAEICNNYGYGRTQT